MRLVIPVQYATPLSSKAFIRAYLDTIQKTLIAAVKHDSGQVSDSIAFKSNDLHIEYVLSFHKILWDTIQEFRNLKVWISQSVCE